MRLEILRLKTRANKVAKDIVSDLNSQLVDMYMVSILSNLYTAQKNVETSNKIQSTNIGSIPKQLTGFGFRFEEYLSKSL